MTKTQFLEKYRAALVAQCAWARDRVRLERFMDSVEVTLRTEGNPWNHHSEIAKNVLRALGFKGKPTLKAMRALPD